ncbi:NADH-quinone oxidoreductase subunit K, partial [Myxococcota bacterium]|nr:NADH-quinone oxidoreductase subunit K [Myxococcota bacterium]
KGASDLTVSANVMDPVPQAMVLTAIVIGVGTTALMLAVIVRLYARHKTLDVNTLARLKW